MKEKVQASSYTKYQKVYEYCLFSYVSDVYQPPKHAISSIMLHEV